MICEHPSHGSVTAFPNCYHKVKDHRGHHEQVAAEVAMAQRHPHVSRWEGQCANILAAVRSIIHATGSVT